ncbi:MAG TPA: hypothetical protein VLY24_15475 [Bryobacteraceae bacterium]|nr:hypothetical protein [Bryobacteraceae bacterium]
MRRYLSWIAALAALAACGFVPTVCAQGQSVLTGGGVDLKSPPPAGTTPRTKDGKPDFSGVWNPDRHFIYDITSALKPGEVLALQPWAAELTKKRLSKEDPEANCLPTGVPRLPPYPLKIVQTPSLLVILFEGNIHSYRQVFLDGRSHPKDLDPTWYGDSIGKWDGDTLVIDTVGFNDKFWFDFAGHPHTDNLHITERYRRPDLGHLEEEVTIDDPGAYTKPFTMYGHFPLDTNAEIMEYICNENNQDVQHIVGKDSRK